MQYIKRFLIWLKERSALDKTLVVGGLIGLAFVVGFFVWWLGGGNDIEVINVGENDTITSGLSRLSGLPCSNLGRRPVAVMMAADNVARPLSSLTKADAVFEMPVTPNKIPRYMAVFQCNEVDEIGSIRSAREDFLPLVGSLNALYVHWGGEATVLSELNNGVLDNIDGLKYEGSTFYRKNGVPMPHNGFTTMELILKRAESRSYDLGPSFSGYLHDVKEPTSKNLANLATTIRIDYAEPYEVVWEYNESSKTYKRSRGGRPETDRTDGNQVSAGTVLVMETESKVLNQDYISVNIHGRGPLKMYKYGVVTSGYWEKGSQISDKLYFYTNDGKEMSFAPGILWVNIVTEPK